MHTFSADTYLQSVHSLYMQFTIILRKWPLQKIAYSTHIKIQQPLLMAVKFLLKVGALLVFYILVLHFWCSFSVLTMTTIAVTVQVPEITSLWYILNVYISIAYPTSEFTGTNTTFTLFLTVQQMHCSRWRQNLTWLMFNNIKMTDRVFFFVVVKKQVIERWQSPGRNGKVRVM